MSSADYPFGAKSQYGPTVTSTRHRAFLLVLGTNIAVLLEKTVRSRLDSVASLTYLLLTDTQHDMHMRMCTELGHTRSREPNWLPICAHVRTVGRGDRTHLARRLDQCHHTCDISSWSRLPPRAPAASSIPRLGSRFSAGLRVSKYAAVGTLRAATSP